MKSAPFDYFTPKTVSEATSALALDERTAMVIAGGQSLVPMLNLRVANPDLLVDIGRLDELKETSATAARVRIGALVTHADIEDGGIPDFFGGLLRKIAAGISYRAIRHYGTIGGSVALADPAADWPVALLALEADVRIASRSETRSQPINEFIKDQYATSLAKDEIILGFDIPIPKTPLRWGMSKVVRKSGAFASSIAIVVEDKIRNTLAVALGAAGPRPHLLPITGKAVKAEMPDDKLIAAIANDLATYGLSTDSYLARLHTSTVARAVREMRSKWHH
jgi:aerobic carbon-monoxide dehydrogenase medium subunit